LAEIVMAVTGMVGVHVSVELVGAMTLEEKEVEAHWTASAGDEALLLNLLDATPSLMMNI
jgi:hypothetical protein